MVRAWLGSLLIAIDYCSCELLNWLVSWDLEVGGIDFDGLKLASAPDGSEAAAVKHHTTVMILLGKQPILRLHRV